MLSSLSDRELRKRIRRRRRSWLDRRDRNAHHCVLLLLSTQESKAKGDVQMQKMSVVEKMELEPSNFRQQIVMRA